MAKYPTGVVVAGTGHRRFPNGVVEIVQDWVSNMLWTLQPRKVISGMALGFDTYLAEAAIKQKIPLIAAIPFKEQPDRWSDHQRVQYRKLLKRAATVEVVCGAGYAAWKFQKRNRWMVDNCDLLLAAWTGKGGGTANCVAYAQEAGRRVEFLPGLRANGPA